MLLAQVSALRCSWREASRAKLGDGSTFRSAHERLCDIWRLPANECKGCSARALTACGLSRAAEDTGAFVNDECCVPRTGGGVTVPVMAATCIPQLLARE